jgi:hypothetical protein
LESKIVKLLYSWDKVAQVVKRVAFIYQIRVTYFNSVWKHIDFLEFLDHEEQTEFAFLPLGCRWKNSNTQLNEKILFSCTCLSKYRRLAVFVFIDALDYVMLPSSSW